MTRTVRLAVLALCALLVIVFYLKSSEHFSRLEFAAASSAAMLLLTVGRYVFVRHLAAIVGGNPFSSILILDGDEPRPAGDFSVVMAADTYFDPDGHDPVMYDRLAKSLATADRVVIACPPARRETWARINYVMVDVATAQVLDRGTVQAEGGVIGGAVDLVTEPALENPYLRRQIEAHRRQLFPPA